METNIKDYFHKEAEKRKVGRGLPNVEVVYTRII